MARRYTIRKARSDTGIYDDQGDQVGEIRREQTCLGFGPDETVVSLDSDTDSDADVDWGPLPAIVLAVIALSAAAISFEMKTAKRASSLDAAPPTISGSVAATGGATAPPSPTITLGIPPRMQTKTYRVRLKVDGLAGPYLVDTGVYCAIASSPDARLWLFQTGMESEASLAPTHGRYTGWDIPNYDPAKPFYLRGTVADQAALVTVSRVPFAIDR